MSKVKVPPHNEDAEASVLGAILIDKDAINIASETLRSSDFYNPIHGFIFDAMIMLYDKSEPIDVVTLTTMLKKKKTYEKVGASLISDLVNSVPTAANIAYYSSLIKDASVKRSLIQIGGEVTELGFSDDDTKEILDKVESRVFGISQGQNKQAFTSVKEALAASFDRIDELHKKGAGFRGIKSGFPDLDNVLSGMQNSNLLILAARPGQGKTAMAVNIAQNVSILEKAPVGIFSLEMSKEELVDRLLVGQADVDSWRLKTGKLSESDFTKLSEAMGQLAEAEIYIDDTPGISVTEMRSKARRLQLEHGIKMIIVDYLQLVDPGRRYDSRVQEVSIVSQGLKNLARELKIPVLALSQLSRAVEHRGEKKPQLADLRESGSIEQDADVVMFLYRVDDELTPNMLTKLLIAKHRNGPTGEIDLLFRGDRIKFYSVDKQSGGMPPPPNTN